MVTEACRVLGPRRWLLGMEKEADRELGPRRGLLRDVDWLVEMMLAGMPAKHVY